MITAAGIEECDDEEQEENKDKKQEEDSFIYIDLDGNESDWTCL